MGIIHQAIEGLPNITEWVVDGTVVELEEAQRRAEICLECPKHEEASATASVIASGIRRLIELKNKLGLRVDGEKRLGQCSVCSCILKLQVWEPMELVEKQRNKALNYDPQCWKIEP